MRALQPRISQKGDIHGGFGFIEIAVNTAEAFVRIVAKNRYQKGRLGLLFGGPVRWEFFKG